MVTVKQIIEEIEEFKVDEVSKTIDVEFEDYILQIGLKDMDGLELNKENIAKVIFDKYQ